MLQIDFSNFNEVKTTRLLLRKISSSDAAEILHLRSDEKVMQYIAREKAVTIEDAEVFINRIIQSWESNDGITWAITMKDNPDTLIGTIGYWRLIKEHYRGEIGYMLNPAYWNQGIMTEALREVIEVGFSALKLHSIEAHIDPANIASASILISTGFLKEAFFRENFFFNGTFKDTEVYSKLQHTRKYNESSSRQHQ